jgi:hypothetical protein
MIESRIRRALLAASLLIIMGFGGYSAFKFVEAIQLQASGQEWNNLNGAWYAANCEGERRDPDVSRICSDSWSMRSYYSYAPGRSMETAAESLAIATGGPIALWAIVFLVRWIWRGTLRNSQRLVVEKHSLLNTRAIFWTLGTAGCLLLFAINALILGSERAMGVLISAGVQGVGLVFAAWAISKARDARRRRTGSITSAAQPGAAAEPPQAAGR